MSGKPWPARAPVYAIAVVAELRSNGLCAELLGDDQSVCIRPRGHGSHVAEQQHADELAEAIRALLDCEGRYTKADRCEQWERARTALARHDSRKGAG